MNNRERLIDVITRYNLDRIEISEMLKVKRETVDHWLLPPESSKHEEVPEMAIELLEIKLKIREQNRDSE